MRLVFVNTGSSEPSSKIRCYIDLGQVNHYIYYVSELENISGFGNTEQEARFDWYAKFQEASADVVRMAAAYNELVGLVSEAKHKYLPDDILFKTTETEDNV